MDARWLNQTPTQNPISVEILDRESLVGTRASLPPKGGRLGRGARVESHVELRRTLRRAVRLPCVVVSHYSDDPALYVASDISELGLWIETPLPLHSGAELVVCFRPPRWIGPDLTLFARVQRATTGRRRADRGPLGMGVEFLDLEDQQRLEVIDCLRDTPPPLRRSQRITPVTIRRRAA